MLFCNLLKHEEARFNLPFYDLGYTYLMPGRTMIVSFGNSRWCTRMHGTCSISAPLQESDLELRYLYLTYGSLDMAVV